jgi:ribosomal protein S13
MKAIHKKVLTGTLAAGLLIGGGLVLQHNQVFADETSALTPTPTSDIHTDKNNKGFAGHGKRSDFEGQGKGFGKGAPNGVFEFGKGGLDFATILGIDQTVLKDEIKQGKTMLQIAQEKAGMTEDGLLQKLTEAETIKIDEALSAGKITQEQADKMKSGLANRLKKVVEAKPKVGGFQGKTQTHIGIPARGAWGNVDEIATLLGLTKEEVAAQQKVGKSLAEIAQEKGITEDQLIAKLKDNMTDELKKFVERKGDSHQGGLKPGAKSDANSGSTATPTPTTAQ